MDHEPCGQNHGGIAGCWKHEESLPQAPTQKDGRQWRQASCPSRRNCAPVQLQVAFGKTRGLEAEELSVAVRAKGLSRGTAGCPRNFTCDLV